MMKKMPFRYYAAKTRKMHYGHRNYRKQAWVELFTVTFGKSRYLVTQSTKCRSGRYSAKTYSMY